MAKFGPMTNSSLRFVIENRPCRFFATEARLVSKVPADDKILLFGLSSRIGRVDFSREKQASRRPESRDSVNFGNREFML